jgi:hypothetical protein
MVLPPQCACWGEAVTDRGPLCLDCFRLTGFITDPGCMRCGVPFSCAAQRGGVDCVRSAVRRPRYAAAHGRLGVTIRRPVGCCCRSSTPTGRRLPALWCRTWRAGGTLPRQADLLVPVHGIGDDGSRAATTRQRCWCARGRPPVWATPPPWSGAGGRRCRRGAAVAGGAARRVRLIGHVMTSGPTANACAAALQAAGAVGVDVLVGACVPDPRLA